MKIKLFFPIFVSLIFCSGITQASKILVLHPSPSVSHVIVARPLINELARRGHDVTMFSQFPQSKAVKNLRDIEVEVNESLSEMSKNFVSKSGSVTNMFKNIPKMMKICARGAEAILEHPEFKRMVKEEQIDLVIVGMFTTHFMFGAAGLFKAPQIGIWSAGTYTGINMVVGNPYEVSAVPHIQMKSKGSLTFLERTQNFLLYAIDVAMFGAFNYYQNVVYTRNFPSENFMTYDEAKSNVSLILLNNHFSQDHIRPFVPGLVEVGGLQIKTTPSPLPEVRKLFLINFRFVIYIFLFSSGFKNGSMELNMVSFTSVWDQMPRVVGYRKRKLIF